jgi:hypothetical protein
METFACPLLSRVMGDLKGRKPMWVTSNKYTPKGTPEKWKAPLLSETVLKEVDLREMVALSTR